MNFDGVVIRSDLSHQGRPGAEFRFGPWFEEEHGVGVLTDGQNILGLGYSHDVSLFEE